MKWWLVTWSTYASWLPGDPRGFQTWRGKEYVPPPKRYAKAGEETYKPQQYAKRLQNAKDIVGEPVKLVPKDRQVVLEAVVAEVDKLELSAAVLAISAEHAHLLAKFGELKIRTTVGFLKGEATKALREAGFNGDPWARECHMKSKREGREFQISFSYVRRHEVEWAAIYVWPAFRDLPDDR